MNVSDLTNHFIYFFSLCSPIVCSYSDSEGPKEASVRSVCIICFSTYLHTYMQVCQYDNVAKNDLFYNLGKTELSEFRMENLSYFHIIYGGGDSIYNGHGEITGQ